MERKLSFPDPWKLIYYAMKSIGLAPFVFEGERFHPPRLLDQLYPIVLATVYTVAATIILLLRQEMYTGLSPFMKRMNIMSHVISFMTPFCIIATFVFIHKHVVDLMNKLCTLSHELRNVGVEEDSGKLGKNVFLTSLIVNIFFIAICVILALKEPGWTVEISIVHNIQEFIFLNVILMFTNILACVKQRFALLNEKLSDRCQVALDVKLSYRTRILVTAQLDGSDSDSFQRIHRIKALHLHLCDVMEQTTRLFAVPMLLISCQFFVMLVVSCYWMYFTLLDSTYFDGVNIGTMLGYSWCPILRMATVIAEIFIIACASRQACMQGNVTQSVLHKLWNISRVTESEYSYEFLMFSLQLLQNPLTVSVFGFFNLDYCYLYKIFGTVLAYVIITIQFDTSYSNTD